MSYRIIFMKKALKDIPRLKEVRLSGKAQALIDVIRDDPFRTPPPYEKLSGDLQGLYFRRINVRHRLVYQVREEDKIIKILSMWSHYEI